MPTTITTTPTLADQVASCIRRHLDGDPEAMTDLTRQVRPWLFHIARSYRLPHELTDDVVQSTMLAALLHIHRLREPGSGLSWLSVVARREALRPRERQLADGKEQRQQQRRDEDELDNSAALIPMRPVRVR